MATSDGWLVTDAGRLTVGQAASATLRTRLDTVWSELHAACESPTHAEHVHQLRVATRRALAAFDAFEGTVSAKRRDWFQKRLRRLRRASGEARDLDVLTARLTSDGAVRARGRLCVMLSKQRHASREPIRRQLEKLVDVSWTSRVDRLVAHVRRRRSRSDFRAFARKRLEPMVEAFFGKGDRRLREQDEIHGLRIEGKKLRYALEIFAPVLPGRRLARCQHSLEQLQNTLGEFTDHASAADRFERWARCADAGPDRDALVSLCDDENRRADRARKAFSKWWDRERRRSLRHRFEEILRRSA